MIHLAAAPPPWTKPAKTGSHLDKLPLKGWAFCKPDTAVTLLLTSGADHQVLSPTERKKISVGHNVPKNPSIHCLILILGGIIRLHFSNIRSDHCISFALVYDSFRNVYCHLDHDHCLLKEIKDEGGNRSDTFRNPSALLLHLKDANWLCSRKHHQKGVVYSNSIHIWCFRLRQ